MDSSPDPADDSGASRATRTGRAHVCPWWLGYALVSPLRRLVESPERLLAPFVRPGMTVVEPGCGMGFFSLSIARMVGPTGTLVCVDLQPRMLNALLRRARRAGLADRIRPVACTAEDLGLAPWRASADLVVAIHMVHEVPDRKRLLQALYDVLRPGGVLLVVEPRGHVSREDFARTLHVAGAVGFSPSAHRAPSRRLAAVFTRASGSG